MSYLSKNSKEFDERQLLWMLKNIEQFKNNEISLGLLVSNLTVSDLINNITQEWKDSFERYRMEIYSIDSSIAIDYEEKKRSSSIPTDQELQEVNTILSKIIKLVWEAHNQIQLKSMLEIIDLYKNGQLPLFESSYELEALFSSLYDLDLEKAEAFKHQMLSLDKISALIIDQKRELATLEEQHQINGLLDQAVLLIEVLLQRCKK